MDDGAAADPHLVYGIYAAGGFPSHVFRIALILDVFSPLADGPKTADDVASQRGTHRVGTRAVLDYLVGRELLQQRGSTYLLTETARRFLLPGERAYAGEYILEHSSPEIWDGVLEVLRGGAPRSPDLPWQQDAWLESYRPDRPAEAREMWRAAGVNATEELRVLDLASGCGIKSLVLAQDHPGVLVTLVDTAAVLDVAQDLAARMGVTGQIDCVAGDALSVVLTPSAFDVVLLGQITYYLDSERNTELFTRSRHTLVSGGALVIDAIMRGDQPSIWVSTVTLLALGMSHGAAYSFSECRSWLQAAGFADIRALGEHWCVARTEP